MTPRVSPVLRPLLKLAILIAFLVPSFARPVPSPIPTPVPGNDEWQPVSPDDLALKDNPASPGSHAMYLYREVTVDGKKAAIFTYIRIKIFTQKGTENGDVAIPFTKGLDDIKDIRARTIRPDGTILDFSGKPFDKILAKAGGIKILEKTFTLPDVQPGCIIEYKYRDQYEYLSGASWPLQGELYTRFARFTYVPSGTDPRVLAFRRYLLPSEVMPQKEKDGTFTLDMHDLAGVEEENFMPPVDTMRAKVEFFYRSEDDTMNETAEQYWKRTSGKVNDFLDGWLNKKKALEQDLGRTVAANDSPEIKLRKIYARVQQVRNRSYEESKTEQEEKHEKLKENQNVEDVLKHGYGSAEEINFLFVGLARAAGFDAALTMVADRHQNFFLPNMQDWDELNAEIIWVRTGDKEYYLDPASLYSSFGTLDWKETDTSGIRIRKKGGDFVDIKRPPSSETTILRHADLQLDSEGQLAGKLQIDFTGQEASLRREDLRHDDDLGRRKVLADKIKDWLPSGSSFEVFGISNWDRTAEPLHVEGDLKIPSFGTVAGRRILMPISLFQNPMAKSFQSADRRYDVYFPYPFEEHDNVKLHCPAGYRIETLPPAQKVDLGGVRYDISTSQSGELLEIKRTMVIDAVRVPRKAYSSLRSFFQSVKSNDDAQVVIQRADAAKTAEK